jgi:NADH:ubiquinone oxidoreductase subunit K
LTKSNNQVIHKELTPLIHSIIVSVIVIVLGVILSFISKDWTWFSRSGSLLVVIGIIVAANDINKSLAVLEDSKFSEQILERIKEIRPDVEENEINNRKEEILGLLKELMTQFYRRIELAILITGTIVWGFGDLIGTLY